MLTRMEEKDFDRLWEWAYGLSRERAHASYPSYTDGIKTKDDFLRREREGLTREHEEILLAEYGGRATGWIHWYYLPEDNYAATCTCLTASNTAETLDELTRRVAEIAPGAKLTMGFPAENEAACRWAEANGFRLLDDLIDTACHLDDFRQTAIAPEIELVTRENFDDFRRLHDGEDMYWNSERMLISLEKWRIFIYREGGKAVAAAYVMEGEVLAEVFGIDGEPDDKVRRALMEACMMDEKARGQRHLVYFAEEKETALLREMGFVIHGAYRSYAKIMGV